MKAQEHNVSETLCISELHGDGYCIFAYSLLDVPQHKRMHLKRTRCRARQCSWFLFLRSPTTHMRIDSLIGIIDIQKHTTGTLRSYADQLIEAAFAI